MSPLAADALAALSAAVFVADPDGVGAVRDALEATGAAGELAVDCEAAGYHRYSDRLCLVQLSTGGTTFVLDPLAVELEPVLRPALEDPRRQVIMHGAAYDLRLLRRDLRTAVTNLFDTQVAAALAGEPAVGLQALLERHMGVRVNKKFQRADWAARPLSREMIEYAADDTRHLARLAAVLEEKLTVLGRTAWAEEECRLLAEVATEPEPAEEPDPVTRVKGAAKLDPRTVTALRRALQWRDEVARAMDRAPFRVASDAALVGVALARPVSVSALSAVRGFSPRFARTRSRSLLDAMKNVRQAPAEALVPYPRRPRTPGKARLAPEAEAAFERLKAVRNRVADELGLARGTVMSNHVLRRVAKAEPTSRAELETLPEVRRWHAEVLGGELLNAL